MEKNCENLKLVFDAMPMNSVQLLPDAPKFTIVAVTNDFLKVTGRTRESLLNRGLFEVFPNNPSDPSRESENILRSSLEYTIRRKEPFNLSLQRYDIPNAIGEYEEHYWSANNQPVLDNNGELIYLIHTTNNVTAQVMGDKKVDQMKGIEKAYHLFMKAPVAVCIVKGPDYIVEFANDQMLQLLGRTPEIIAKPIWESLPEARAQGLITILDHVRNTGENYQDPNFPAEIVINGVREKRYFDLVFQPYYQNHDDPTPSGIFCVAYNVTQQVLIQKKIEDVQQQTDKQKRLYEAITGSTPDLIYVFDLNYRFTYANQALLTMWGKQWEEAIGKGLKENGYESWHAAMHEKEIDQVVSTKLPIRGEVSFPHAALGKRIYDYIFVPVLNTTGEVEAVAGTTRDITEIKLAEQLSRESEERFRNLADESPMFVFIIDAGPDAPVSYWNKTWLKYTGQTMEEANGRAWDGIIHPDDVSIVMSHYQLAFENRKPYFISALRVKRKDGVFRWHAFKGNPRFLTDGSFAGYIGVGFDIHEQKLNEEAVRQSEALLQQKIAERTAELQKTVKKLEQSNVNLEDFAYAASHDLKEPIRKIHFFADRLEKELTEKLSVEQKLLFGRLENASRRMGSLIDELLSYSQATKGVGDLEEVDLNSKVQLVLEDLELEVQEKKAIITVDTLPTIKGNQRQLQQMVQNLITNSLKYSKQGDSPTIYISSRKVKGGEVRSELPIHEADKLYYLIQVQDNGIGFPQEDAERIFNVFTRLHGSSEYRGSGVGLSIVQKVVQNHQGYIWAIGSPGEGAVFNVMLPVV
ncbi:MAG: PAS domain-containing sensor histidine kinase [Flavisolibacter sp.]